MIVLKIQQKKPRFLIPKRYRYKLVGDDYYRYEHDFEDEAIYCDDLLLDEEQQAAPQINESAVVDEDRKIELIYERL